MFNVKGMVTSPMYPKLYRVSSTCRWDIAVPRPNSVKISFKGVKYKYYQLLVYVVENNSLIVLKYAKTVYQLQHIISKNNIFNQLKTNKYLIMFFFQNII